jgi:hypothetical protein
MRSLGVWIAVVLCATSGAAAGTAWLVRRRRVPPEERERRRRAAVTSKGRLGSATITDYHDGVVSYTYTVGGVEYSASQDVSSLTELLPGDPTTLIARPANLRYLLANPANSILVSEDWSGLRYPPQTQNTADAAS